MEIITRGIRATKKTYDYYLFYTTWKVFVFGVFLVRIFPHLDWIRRDTPYLSVFSPNAGKYRHFSRSVTNHQKRKLVDFLKKYSCIIYVKISLECKFEKVYTQTEPKLSALTLKLSKASMSLSKDDSYKKYIFRKIYDKKCFRSVNFYSYATHYVYVKSSQHNKLV